MPANHNSPIHTTKNPKICPEDMVYRFCAHVNIYCPLHYTNKHHILGQQKRMLQINKKKTLFYFNIFCLNEFIIFLYQAIDFQDSNKMCRKCPSFREPSKLASVDRLEIYPNNNGISLVYIHLPLSP